MLPCPNFHVALFSSHTGTEPTVTHHEATCLIIRCDFARRAVALREGGGIELKNPRHRRQRSPRRPSARGSERVSIHVSKTISWFLFQFLLRHPVHFDDLPVGSLLSEFCHRNSMLSFSANDQQSIGPAS